MEKESTQTVLTYEHQRQIGKSGFRKGHESWATRKVISMRNNPKPQRWEKSETVLGGQRGRSTEVGRTRRVRRSSQPRWGERGTGSAARSLPALASQWVPSVPCCHLRHPGHPSSSRTSGWAAWQGCREREDHQPRRAGEHMLRHNLALPNYPARLDFGWLPPSRLPCPPHPTCPTFPGMI